MDSSRPSLMQLAHRHGTDKGSHHCYIPVYEEMLGHLRDEKLSLLEIGVFRGSSLKMWLDYFPRAEINGIDIVPPDESLMQSLLDVARGRLACWWMDQTDEQQLRLFPVRYFDIIIDDGSHNPWHQLITCHALWRCLKPGGFYFVEDLQCHERLDYWRMMPGFRFWEGRDSKADDDRLVMLRKPD